ncbi:MAG: ATP-binding cassette domain-containing protein [Anaerolineae bacterium]|nr:ATP-binding cassette domain-containing protein [Anaerolineae bacterium]
MPETAVLVQDVSKSYGSFKAVDDMRFDVRYGEIFAVIGPNGAGKSTMLRMILDILKPDTGQIRVFGEPINAAAKDKIGYLPEERGLYKNVNLLDMLVYLGQLKGMSRRDARQKATHWLERLDLGEYLKKKVTALSKGMAQKVQFVATILHEPRLLIVDEPFSGLDPVNTQVLSDLVYEMKGEGRAIIMSTHQMHQVEEMAERVLMINRGQRVVYGPVNTVRNDYASRAVEVVGQGDFSRLPGVTRVENGRRDTYTLFLDAQTEPDQIMRALADGDYRVERFERALPGLAEIFIRVVGEGAAPEVRT